MPTPGERLESHPQPARPCALAEFAEIGGRAIDAALRSRRDIAADEEQIGPQLLHQIEFALGADKIPRALRLRHAFEVAERLERADRKAKLLAEHGNVTGRAIEGEQVVFKNFDGVEIGGSDDPQLLFQRAAERDRGDRACHHCMLPGD